MVITAPSDLNFIVHSFRFRGRLPTPLPSFHITPAKFLSEIVRQKALVPRYRHEFGTNVLFLFYGGSFYSTDDFVSREVGELPVAFMFDPYVLEEELSLYPFDTGAHTAGYYGLAGNMITPIARFRVAGRRNYDTPCRLVRLIFGNNDRYLRADPHSACNRKPEPLPSLYAFMSADTTRDGADRRKYAIECHATAATTLDRRLLWVAFPDAMYDHYLMLLSHLRPHRPEPYVYSYPKDFCPRKIAGHLEMTAHEFVQRRYIST